ncbi:MAG: NADH-quinone oxidoreductase subunit C [Candidatus Aenigmarchaeota archaeon]|nr:NADH-quinone oxidoreductase subunit C [Candidatus Aenigmarchaeota archaeon]
MELKEELNLIGKIYREEEKEVWSIVPYKKIRDVIEDVFLSRINRISSISGYDNGKEIEVIYHFVKDNSLINIKVLVPKKLNKIETITDLFPGAFLLERELSEMLGIKIIGHPKPGKLFLPENWKGKPPLRKG